MLRIDDIRNAASQIAQQHGLDKVTLFEAVREATPEKTQTSIWSSRHRVPWVLRVAQSSQGSNSCSTVRWTSFSVRGTCILSCATRLNRRAWCSMKRERSLPENAKGFIIQEVVRNAEMIQQRI